MATRRARIKVAPNIGAAGRNRNRPDTAGGAPGTPEQRSVNTAPSPSPAANAAAKTTSLVANTERRPVTPTTASRLNNNHHHRLLNHQFSEQKPALDAGCAVISDAAAVAAIDVEFAEETVLSHLRETSSPLPELKSPKSDHNVSDGSKPLAVVSQDLPPTVSPDDVVTGEQSLSLQSSVVMPVTNEIVKEDPNESVANNASISSPLATVVEEEHVAPVSPVPAANSVGGGSVAPIRRQFGLKAKFKPNVVAAAAERHRHLVGDIPQRSRKPSTSDSKIGSPRPGGGSSRLRSTSESEQQPPGGKGHVYAAICSPPPPASRQRLRSASASEEEEAGKRRTPSGGLTSGSANGETRPLSLRLPPTVQRASIICSPTADGLPSTPLLDSGVGGAGTGSGEAISSSLHNIAEITTAGAQAPSPRMRSRRLTETSSIASAPSSPFNAARHRRVSSGAGMAARRRGDRRRMMAGAPERRAMTMFDLIYFNPENGSRMSSSSTPADEETRSVVGDAERVVEEAVDNPEVEAEERPKPPSPAATPTVGYGDMEEEDEGDAMPVPQVKVGANGEIILDEASTLVETSATKRAKADLTNSPVVVETSGTSNYGTWSRRGNRRIDWSETETVRFYRALAVTGTDFSMMASLFKKRSRAELKLKFKREEKYNRQLVDKCLFLQGGGQYTDIQDFPEEESEEEEQNEEEEAEGGASRRGRRRRSTTTASRKRRGTAAAAAAGGQARTRRRGSYINRGYYASSSDGDEGDVSETSRSPSRKRAKPNQPAQPNSRRESVSSPRPQQQQPASPRPASIGPAAAAAASPQQPHQLAPSAAAVVTGATVAPTAAALPPLAGGPGMVGTPLQRLPGGVQFPPALLAANPGLLGAQPGSLVVVASPSKTDPNAQLLHVYMVKNRRTPLGPSPLASSPSSPCLLSPMSPQPIGDPERTRIDPAVVRAMGASRQSMGERDKLAATITGGDRVRTYSEGALYRRLRTVSEGGSSSTLFSPGRIRTLSGSTQDLTNSGLAAEPPAAVVAATTTTMAAAAVLNTITANISSTSAVLGNSASLPIAIKSRPIS